MLSSPLIQIYFHLKQWLKKEVQFIKNFISRECELWKAVQSEIRVNNYNKTQWMIYMYTRTSGKVDWTFLIIWSGEFSWNLENGWVGFEEQGVVLGSRLLACGKPNLVLAEVEDRVIFSNENVTKDPERTSGDIDTDETAQAHGLTSLGHLDKKMMQTFRWIMKKRIFCLSSPSTHSRWQLV